MSDRSEHAGTITAYTKGPDHGWAIEPAPPTRQWMDDTQQRFAYKCQPLVMANQAGWVLRIPADVRATWAGGKGMADMTIEFPAGAPDHFRKQVLNTFGHGILSFVIPWIFRTPEGVGLWVRGVPNRSINGAAPLEGIVETDWATEPFTMNWRILEPNSPVTFRKGEPICMIAPFPLDLVERLEPQKMSIHDDPEMLEALRAFIRTRQQQHAQGREQIRQGKTTYDKDFWKLDYLKGRTASGERADRHRTNFKLKPFDSPRPPRP